MTYYHLHCLQNHVLMATGRNSETLADLKDSLLSFLSADHDDAELEELNKLPTRELCEMYEFGIEETDKPLPDPLDELNALFIEYDKA